MTTGYDVPADKLIAKIADGLKGQASFNPPEWAEYAKTGVHREKAPVENDWWYTRVAAILRKIYVYGPIGTVRLSAEFGGPKNRGSKPETAARGSRSIARKGLQQLEKEGFVEKQKSSGRAITAKGQKLVDNMAFEVSKEMAK